MVGRKTFRDERRKGGGGARVGPVQDGRNVAADAGDGGLGRDTQRSHQDGCASAVVAASRDARATTKNGLPSQIRMHAAHWFKPLWNTQK